MILKVKKERIIMVLWLSVAVILSACSLSKNSQEYAEARAEEELYEYEIYKDGIAQGRHEVEGYLEEIKYSIPPGEYIELERLIEIIYEEYGEDEAEQIIERIIHHSDNIIICPSEIIDDVLADYSGE